MVTDTFKRFTRSPIYERLHAESMRNQVRSFCRVFVRLFCEASARRFFALSLSLSLSLLIYYLSHVRAPCHSRLVMHAQVMLSGGVGSSSTTAGGGASAFVVVAADERQSEAITRSDTVKL